MDGIISEIDEHFEPLEQNPDFLRILEKVVDQNAAILEMNRDLTNTLSGPLHIYVYIVTDNE